jgi:hypothetical protein
MSSLILLGKSSDSGGGGHKPCIFDNDPCVGLRLLIFLKKQSENTSRYIHNIATDHIQFYQLHIIAVKFRSLSHYSITALGTVDDLA